MNSRQSGRWRRACFALLAVAFSGLAGPPAARAAGPDEQWAIAQLQLALSEADFLDELPVVLSVSRLAQPQREAPAAVTVIDRETIRASGARDLTDLLRLVPGFQVVYTDLGAPLATYHGLGDDEPRRLQVLVDGRSQFSPAFIGAVNWNTLDVLLEDIERIEVVRGTNSAAYGSNAMLGIINVITRHPAAQQGVEAWAAQGSQGVQDRYARIGARLGEAVFRLSAERRADDGLYRDTQAGRPLFDPRRSERASLRADLPLSGSDTLELSAGRAEADVGVRARGVFPADRLVTRSTQHAQLTWRKKQSSHAESALRVAHVDERSEDTVLLAQGPLAALFDHTLDAVRNEIEASHAIHRETLRAVAGAGHRADSVRSRQLYGMAEKVSQSVTRAFAHAEIDLLPQLTASAAGSWEHDSLSGSNFSPRLALVGQPAGGHTLRLAAARGHRVPTLYEERARELYFNIGPGIPGLCPPGCLIDAGAIASGGLAPERVDAGEIGYLYESPRFGLDLRIFEERVEGVVIEFVRPLAPPDCDFLDFPSCGSVRDFENGADVRIGGLEYQANWRPLDATRLSFGQAFIDVDLRALSPAFSPATANVLRQWIPTSAPRRTTTLILQQALGPRWSLFASASEVGAFRYTSGSDLAPEYKRVDWRLAYRFRLQGTQGEVAYTQQVQGRAHQERFASQPVHPRSWLSLRLEH